MASKKDVKDPQQEPGLEKAGPPRVERERSQFRALLLQNPNFFGNLKESPFKAIKSIVSNASYEELKCVGFQPQLNRLEAVVWIKRDTGYDGDVCSSGSPEYVRFWLSYDNGATWLDQGMEIFTAYDIPGDHPLEYAVTLSITPRRRLCFRDNMLLVRAILSWNHPPVDPNTPPVWGNVLDARIQVDPLFLIDFPDFLEDLEVGLPPALEKLIEPAQSLKLKAPLALNAAQLKAAYAGKDVPPHRFLQGEILKHVGAIVSRPASTSIRERRSLRATTRPTCRTCAASRCATSIRRPASRRESGRSAALSTFTVTSRERPTS